MQVSIFTKRLQDLPVKRLVRNRSSGYYTELGKLGVGYISASTEF